MFEEEDFKSLLITKINLSDDSKELVKIYNEHTTFSFEILHKLLSLKDFSEFLSIWNLSCANLKKNPSELKKLDFSSKEISEIAESKIVESFLSSLLDIAIHYDCSYESFRICQLISEIIQIKKQFPTKNWTISYFSLISKFFKSNNLFSAYLNMLYILKDYTTVQISKNEYDFYLKVEQIKQDVTPRDLFCGLKLKECHSLNFEFSESDFVYDPIWDEIFNLKVKNTIENLSFIMKNGLAFEIKNDYIAIQPGKGIKFVSKIFEIANSYRVIPVIQPVEERIIEKPVQNESKVSVPIAKEEKVVERPSFKNRFTNLYKKFKLIHKYSTVEFNDIYFEERNKLRNDQIKALKDTLEIEKQKLSIYNDVVDDLKRELKYKMDIKMAENEARERERIKAEEKSKLEERRANMWRNKSSVDTSTQTPSTANPPSFENVIKTPNTETKGIYKPNLSAIQSSIKNYKSDHLPKTEDKPATKSGGPWRTRTPKDQNADSSK